MTDEYAIQQLLNRYSITASRGEWDEAVSTYVPEGVWDVPALGVKFEGREAIKNGMMGFTAQMSCMVQINSPALIEVDGDTATARCAIRESGKYRERDAAMEILGGYDDTLVRTKDGWRFTKRVFVLAGMHDVQVVPAPAR
jgi:hypothetical protein